MKNFIFNGINTYNMKTIQDFTNKQISIDFTSKLYGGGNTYDGKMVITSPTTISAKTFTGMILTANDGTKVKMDECSNKDENTVECEGSVTAAAAD